MSLRLILVLSNVLDPTCSLEALLEAFRIADGAETAATNVASKR